ncbi:MAG: DUF2752 domain-containing protein [Oscillospiraceae bacterium]
MKKFLRLHIIIIIVILAVLLIYRLFSFSCPFRLITSIPCPTCGMMRSLFSLLKLDFSAYIYYNPMTLPMIVAILLGFHKDILPIPHKATSAVIIIIAVLTFLIYLFRLLGQSIP